MSKYIYKTPNGFIFAETPLEEPLKEGTTLSSWEEYQRVIAERETTYNQIKNLPINIKRREVEHFKKMLSESDYQAIKYAEGAITEEDYAPIKLQRQQYRDQINQLEVEIAELDE